MSKLDKIFPDGEGMQMYAQLLNELLPEGTGFALVVFPLGGDPSEMASYISNAKREDMIAFLKTMAETRERF